MALYTESEKATLRIRLRLAAGGVAVALAASVGLGGWQVTQHHHGTKAATATRVQAPVQQASTQANDMPATTGNAVTTTTGTPHIYLVASSYEAQLVLGALVAPDGSFPTDDTVLTVESQTSSDELSRLLSTINESRQLRGLPAAQLEDLR